jgi:hypothetical protein
MFILNNNKQIDIHCLSCSRAGQPPAPVLGAADQRVKKIGQYNELKNCAIAMDMNNCAIAMRMRKLIRITSPASWCQQAFWTSFYGK